MLELIKHAPAHPILDTFAARHGRTSMPRRRRTENKSYPTGWTWHHGALYYMVPAAVRDQWDGKKKFRLGANEHEAYKTWAQRIKNPETPVTFDKGFDKFLAEVVPDLSPPTQESYRAAIKELRKPFGKMDIVDFRPHQAYQYRNKRGKAAPTAANRECEVLSAFFSKCFEWGVPLQTHPMIEGKFKKLSRPPRERIVEDWEIEEVMKLRPSEHAGRSAIPMLQAYVLVKQVSGRRRIEILRLKTSDLLENGVRWTLAKRKQSGIKHLVTRWNSALRAAIDALLAARPIGKPRRQTRKVTKPADISPWLVCKADGTPYLKPDGTESDAFGSIWQRFMDKVVTETKVKERFWDSDLRARAADLATSEEHARRLLGHAPGSGITRRHYRRRSEEVDPVG